jgi:two-component system sensor histidine kinase SenX3
MRSSAEAVLRDRAKLPEDDAYLLEDIVGEAAHMGSIVDNMLNLTRLEGSPRIEQDVVDTREIAVRVLDRARVLAQGREIAVEAGELTGAHVLGDPALLEQAVMVFVDNAIKYNRVGGTVWIGSSARGQDAVVEIRDTGEGLAPADVERLGERFFRTDKARGRSTGGLGLGVTIGKRIVALHGGRVEIESALGQGTTVRVVLPRLRA